MKQAILILLMVSNTVVAAQSSTLAVLPVSQQIAIDSVATIGVRIQTSIPIHAYRLEIAYNPAVLRCILAEKDSFFLPGTSIFFTAIDSLNGRIRFDEALIGWGGQRGEGMLVRVKFRGIHNGMVSLSLPVVTLRDTMNQSVAFTATTGTIRIGTGTFVFPTNQLTNTFDRLHCYPNPFNSSVTISFGVRGGDARLSVVSLLGQVIRGCGRMENTDYAVWDGRDNEGRTVSSGVYVVRLVGGGRNVQRMIQLIK